MLNEKRIVIGITGGIASYKICGLVTHLVKEGAKVKVIMTKNATKFINPLTFEALSKNKVVVDMFEEENYNYIGHIEYGQHADIIVVAPATANIIGKVSSGIADDMLSSTIIASTKPVLFVPAMNEHMYLNKIVQNNMEKLKSYGYLFLEPEVGMLACGTSGIGKLPNTKVIFDKIKEVLSEER